MLKFDLHAATQGNQDKFIESALLELGMHADGLATRHVSFYDNVAVSACPLIGLHLTKKYDGLPDTVARGQIKQDLAAIESLFRQRQVTGYAHGEVLLPGCDLTLTSSAALNLNNAWPVEPFKPVFTDSDKKWDIHIAIPVDELDNRLSEVLQASGMYSIDVWKHRNGIKRLFRVFTIQGISNPGEGKQLYDALTAWFRAVNAPHVEIKQETYVGMVRVGKPEIVPPTIARVSYVNNRLCA